MQHREFIDLHTLMTHAAADDMKHTLHDGNFEQRRKVDELIEDLPHFRVSETWSPRWFKGNLH